MVQHAASNRDLSSRLVQSEQDKLKVGFRAQHCPFYLEYIFFSYTLAALLILLNLSASFDTIKHDSLVHLQKSWNLQHTIAVAGFLSGGSVLWGDMDVIHICSTQNLHWCLTRFSAGSSSVLPLYPLPLMTSLEDIFSIPSVLVCSYPHMGFHITAMLMTRNSSSLFLPQFMHRSQHIYIHLIMDGSSEAET